MKDGRIALILAEAGDRAPLLVASAMGSSTRLCPLLVGSGGLASARWNLQVAADGRATSLVELPEACIDDEIGVIWCRCRSLPMPGFATADPHDRDYAAAELRALAVGWLHSLGDRVVNSVDGDGLTGPSWSRIRWLVEGARCGLSPAPVTIATSARAVSGWHGMPYDARRPLELMADPSAETVVVVGRRVVGELATRFGEPCLALAARARCRLLEVSFVREDGEWLMASADPVPMLRTPLEIQAVAEMLTAIAVHRRDRSEL